MQNQSFGYTCSKHFAEYPCSHRQWRHEGHCRFVHGYSRSFTFWFAAKELDEFGLEPLLSNIAKADPKRKLSKTELLETYNKEMPKIDMDIAMAEPVSRGAKDITHMLTKVRDSGRFNESLENLKVMSNDPRLLTALHQPPQDATGMKIRQNILNVMQGTNSSEPPRLKDLRVLALAT